MNYTTGKWTMVPNSSWGEKHKEQFGERTGYVICHYDKGQLCAHASIIGMPFRSQEEINANAKLIAAAPELLEALQKLSKEFWKMCEGNTNDHVVYAEALGAIKSATDE